MQELRFVAVSEDGRYASSPSRGGAHVHAADRRTARAVALGQTSRLAQYEIEVESPLRPKEIQARIRAGETVEEIADAAGIAVERVRWFEGPVLAERAYVADQARTASVRRHGDSTPGPRLGEVVAERLSAIGADPDDAQWDAKKRGDGSWQVQLTFTSGGDPHVAEWVFDPRRRHVLPADDNAARMSLPGAEPPSPAPLPGEATVTRLAPGSALPGRGHGRRPDQPVRIPTAPRPRRAVRAAAASPAPAGARRPIGVLPSVSASVLHSWPRPPARDRRALPARRGDRGRVAPAACRDGARRPRGAPAQASREKPSTPRGSPPAAAPVPAEPLSRRRSRRTREAHAGPARRRTKPGARAGRPRGASAPRSRPGTRSCSEAPARATEPRAALEPATAGWSALAGSTPGRAARP